jgi:RNA methyltransferase, TrmH family
VFYDADRLDPGSAALSALPAQVEAVPVRGDALQKASVLGSGSSVIGVWEMRAPAPAADPDVAVYLHHVSDPGNVGAVLRSALALARTSVFVSPETADPFAPKAVRASMGAIFGQPVARTTYKEACAELGPGWRPIALVPGAGAPLAKADAGRRPLFCLGSERDGLPPALVERCDQVAHVPLHDDGLESLNVAMTATLCLYQHILDATAA